MSWPLKLGQLLKENNMLCYGRYYEIFSLFYLNN